MTEFQILSVYGYEVYECPICGLVYPEFESHENSDCPEYEEFVAYYKKEAEAKK